jgi:outer membrane protein
MRVRLIVGWLVVLSLVAAIGFAQQPPSRSLPLSEALDLARRNNPDYQAVLNNRTPASRSLLSATTSLFTPTFDIGGNYLWLDAGRRNVPGTAISYTGPTTSQWNGGLQLNYSLSGTTISNRGLAAAELRATDEDIVNALTVVETSVRTQYLVTLEAQAQVAVAVRRLERARELFNLAQARYTVGQGTLIDLRRAEVDTGSAAVSLLRARQAAENQVLLLFDLMGVRAPTTNVALTDSFPVDPPRWQMDSLITYALAENPALRSLRAREASARWSVRAARSEYLPSLNLQASTGRRSVTQSSYTGVDTAGNPVTFPEVTDKSTTPWSVSIGVSLPIYNGFARYARTAAARAQEDDLRQAVRARELKVRSDIVAAFHNLEAAYQAVGLQFANGRAAAEAFDLATQRYRVGSGSYLEQLDARLTADQADADYITAVYAYHRSIAALEAAVGRTLR